MFIRIQGIFIFTSTSLTQPPHPPPFLKCKKGKNTLTYINLCTSENMKYNQLKIKE